MPSTPAQGVPPLVRAEPDPVSAEQLDRLLEKTSRTFALSIPLLPEPTRREVGLAYLLFRIADTFEDAECWDVARQLLALEAFADLVEQPAPDATHLLAVEWLREPPVQHGGYLELLREVPWVLSAFHQLRPAAREIIGAQTVRTARGMAAFVARKGTDETLELMDLADLKTYCYVVAGIVGEMLTELFLLGREELQPVAETLRGRAVAFGEALQLVNILKDSAGDAAHGRNFLPASLPRSEVFALARRDLESARAYVRALQEAGADRGIVAFTALPVRMAGASLDRVEEAGPGAKLSRPEVFGIIERMNRALDAGEPAA